MDIEIRLFGPLQVVSPSGRLTGADFPSRKAKQVLQVLALADGRVVSKDRLVDTLWRRRMPRNPSATVELAVSLLRSTLATITDRPVVVTAPGGYRLDTESADVDTARFSQLLQLASESPVADRVIILTEAVRLADRPLFEDELAAEWVAVDRDRLRVKADNAALDLGRLALAGDDAAMAWSMAELVMGRNDAVVEEAFALGVAALAQMGRRRQARTLLAELETRLELEEARLPSSSSRGLQALLDPAPAVDERPVVRVDPAFARVEWPLPFLGRAKELAVVGRAVDEMLATTASSLVVVEGAHGMGLSRFLAEVGGRAADRVHVFEIRGRAADRTHPMLALSLLVRSMARVAKQRRPPAVDESVAVMFGRVADLLDTLGPTLLLVDDADLLDEPSSAVLQALLAPRSVADLLVLAASHEGADELVRRGWPRDAIAARAELNPLDDADLAMLRIADVARRTGGHPATLAACVRAAHRDGVLTADDIDDVLRRVVQLGELGAAALEVMSRRDGPSRTTEVAHALHIGQATAAELLRRAARVGLLHGTVRHGQVLAADVLTDVLRARRTAGESPGISE